MEGLPSDSGQQPGSYFPLPLLGQASHQYLEADIPASFFPHGSSHPACQSSTQTSAMSGPHPLQSSTPHPLQTSTPHPLQTSTLLTLQTSTHPFQSSTSHPLQTTSHPLQTSTSVSILTTPHPLQTSTPHPLQTSNLHPRQSSTPHPLQTSTSNLLQTSTLQSLQTSTLQSLQASISHLHQSSSAHHLQSSSLHLQTSSSHPSSSLHLQTSSSHPSSSLHLQSSASPSLQLTPFTLQTPSSHHGQCANAHHVQSASCHSVTLSPPPLPSPSLLPLQSSALHPLQPSSPHPSQELGEGAHSSRPLPSSVPSQPSLVLQTAPLHQQAATPLAATHSSVAMSLGHVAMETRTLSSQDASQSLHPSRLSHASSEALHVSQGSLPLASNSGGLDMHLTGGSSLPYNMPGMTQTPRELTSPSGHQYAPLLLPEPSTPSSSMLEPDADLQSALEGGGGGLGVTALAKDQLEYEDSFWKRNLHSSLSSLYERECLCDIVLAIGPHEIKTHKLVLGAASGVIQEMLEREGPCGSAKISIFADVDVSSLKTFMQFLYNGEVKVNSFNARDLLDLAQIFKIGPLIQICLDAMKHFNIVKSEEAVVPELSLSLSSLQKSPLMVDVSTWTPASHWCECKATSTEDLHQELVQTSLERKAAIPAAVETTQAASQEDSPDLPATGMPDRKARSARSPQMTVRVPSHSYGTRAATSCPRGRVSAGEKIKDIKAAKDVSTSVELDSAPDLVEAESHSLTRKRGRPPKKALCQSTLGKSEPVGAQAKPDSGPCRERRGGKKMEGKTESAGSAARPKGERLRAALPVYAPCASSASQPGSLGEDAVPQSLHSAESGSLAQVPAAAAVEVTPPLPGAGLSDSASEVSQKALQRGRKAKAKKMSWTAQGTVRAPPKKRAKMEMKRLSELCGLSASDGSSEDETPAEDIQSFLSQTGAILAPPAAPPPQPPTPTAPKPKVVESVKGKKPRRRAGQHDGTVRVALELESRAADISETERQYKCALCGNEFVFAKRSVTHLLRTHHVSLEEIVGHVIIRKRESDPKICDICGYKTKETSFYYIHYHKYFRHGVPLPQGWRPFTCEQCGKECFTKFQLQDHRRTHSERTPYVCEHCGQGFRSRTSYNSHIFHRHNTERKHGCPTCNKHFKTRTQMHVHMRTHTGEKPFACPKCAYRSTTRGNMRLHLANRHKLDASVAKSIMAALKATVEPPPQPAAEQEEEEAGVSTEGGAGEGADPSMVLAASIVEAALRNYHVEEDKPLIVPKQDLSTPMGLLSAAEAGQTMFMLPDQGGSAALPPSQVVTYTLVNGQLLPASLEPQTAVASGHPSSPSSPHPHCHAQTQTASPAKVYLQHSPISPPPPSISPPDPYPVGCGEDLTGVGMVACSLSNSHTQTVMSGSSHVTTLPSSVSGHHSYEQTSSSAAQQQYDSSLMYYQQQQYYPQNY